MELYKKIRPGEPLAVDSAESLITSMFFDARRYDLAKVGRYKFNKKLALKNRVTGQSSGRRCCKLRSQVKLLLKKEQRLQENLQKRFRMQQYHTYWVEGEDT